MGKGGAWKGYGRGGFRQTPPGCKKTQIRKNCGDLYKRKEPRLSRGGRDGHPQPLASFQKRVFFGEWNNHQKKMQLDGVKSGFDSVNPRVTIADALSSTDQNVTTQESSWAA